MQQCSGDPFGVECSGAEAQGWSGAEAQGWSVAEELE